MFASRSCTGCLRAGSAERSKTGLPRCIRKIELSASPESRKRSPTPAPTPSCIGRFPRDGSVHYVECRGTVLVDDDGTPTGTTGVAIDVTERERHKAVVTEALVEQREVIEVLQQALLPAALPHVPGIALAARYVAAAGSAAVGGDWYAVLPVAQGRLGVAIGDVAGHGLSTVADMAAVRFSLRALALGEPRPERVLERLNEVVKVFSSDTMITAVYGVLDPGSRTWTYGSAGHCPTLVRAADGHTRFLDRAVTRRWASPKPSVFERWRSKRVRRCCSIPTVSSNAEPSPSTWASIGCDTYSATVRTRRTRFVTTWCGRCPKPLASTTTLLSSRSHWYRGVVAEKTARSHGALACRFGRAGGIP